MNRFHSTTKYRFFILLNAALTVSLSHAAPTNAKSHSTVVAAAAKPEVIKVENLNNQRAKNSKIIAQKKIVSHGVNAHTQKNDKISSVSASAVRPAPLPASSVTVVKTEEKKVAIPELIVGINNYYTGSTLREPLAGYQPDKDTGYDSGSAELVTHFVLGYKLSSNLSLSLNPQLATTPNYRTYNSDTDSYDSQEGRFMKPVGSFLRLKVGSFYKDSIFNWTGDFRFYPSITDDLKGEKDKVTGEYKDQYNLIRSAQNFTWTVTPKLSLALENTLRFYVRPSAFQNTRDSIQAQTLPTVYYSLTDVFQIYSQYSMRARNKYGQSFFDWSNHSTYLETGFNIEAGKGFSFNPFVTVYPGNHVNMDTSQWGLNIFWSIL